MPLPQGYTLDTPVNLPKGYKLDAPPRRDSAGDAFAGLIEGAGDLLSGIPGTIAHPLNSIRDVFQASKGEYDKAIAAAGPAGDNKGDLFGFLQHTVGMFPVLGPMASKLIDSIGDEKTDVHEQARQMGQILTMQALPAVTERVAPAIASGVKSAAPVVARGVVAAAPDVAVGALKTGAGYALSGLVPHELQVALGFPIYKGTTQMGRGLAKGYKAMRDGPPAPPPEAPYVPQTVDAPLPQSFVPGVPLRPPMSEYAAAPVEATPAAPVPQSFVPGVPLRPPMSEYAAAPVGTAPAAPVPQGFVPGVPVRPPVVAPSSPAAAPLPAGFVPGVPVRPPVGQSAPAAPPAQGVLDLASAATNAAPVSRAQALFDAGRAQHAEAVAPPPELPVAETPVPDPPAAAPRPESTTPAAALRERGGAAHDARRARMNELLDKAREPQRLADAADEQAARMKTAGESAEWAARQRKASRFAAYMVENGMEPTEANLVRATKELAERDVPSAETVDMIHDRMDYHPPAAVSEYDDMEPLLQRSIAEAQAKNQPPAAAPVAPPPEAPAAAGPKPGDVANVHPSTLTADPARFQYKANTGGASGVGDELKSIKEYDPELGGVLSVWKDPADGKTYVVNGHHRLELATRAGAPEVSVRYLKAATAAEARLKGAVINIAEGRGTALDAAKIFRENSMEPADVERVFKVSLKGAIARDGTNLSKLAPSIFTEVVQGDLPVERAAMIGELLPNHADQLAALDLIKRAEAHGKRPTNDAVRELISFVKDAPKKEAQVDSNYGLFGDMPDPEQESAALEMAELSSYVRKRLTGEKKLFGTVADAGKSRVLEAAGNRMGDQNAQLAETAARDLAIYDKLKASAGPINTVLRSGAEALGKGAKPNEIRNFTFDKIRAHVNQLLKTQ